MIFDLFHSISDPVVSQKRIGARRSFDQFFSQTVLAESLGFDTVWLAESHFSSEVQKRTSVATIPHFSGEVGLNADSFQWFHELQRRTKRIALGTGIHNIVGGSGGPIASADRVRTLQFINDYCWPSPRDLRIGVAAGRFPYQNVPFGLVPRNDAEKRAWPELRRYLFLEALEIFLRLLKGETLDSSLTKRHFYQNTEVEKRWTFEPLQLVPHETPSNHLHIVLGSADPLALDIGLEHWDLDLFNLSFTPPEEIEKLHAKMAERAKQKNRSWNRSRLPRTVMVFIDPDSKKAHELAHHVLDTYIEAMRGTAAVPDKKVLLQRALVGDAVEIREQLRPENPRNFQKDDRLMLWFEFNQLEGERVEAQMKYFFDQVVGRL